MASISNIVDVRSRALATIAAAQVFNRGLIFVETDKISYERVYEDIISLKQLLALGFGVNDPIYKQAYAYFQGVSGFLNKPSTLLIAKDIRKYEVPAALYGNKGVDVADVNLAGSGTIDFTIDANSIPVLISAEKIAEGLSAIAAFIQTTIRSYTNPPPNNNQQQIEALKEKLDQETDDHKKQKIIANITKLHDIANNGANPLFPNATCVFDATLNKFTIKSGLSGNDHTIGYCTGDAIADALNLTANSGARLQEGRTGANIQQQMDYLLNNRFGRKQANFAMFGFINQPVYTPGGDDAINKELLDMLNWFKDPLNKFYINRFQFYYQTANSDELNPASTTNLYSWLVGKGFADTRGITLDDGSTFTYTLFNTNVTLAWDRDNKNKAMGGLMAYGASWQVGNVNTYPSWNNQLAALVPNDIDDDEYQVLVNHGFNVYTNFTPAYVDTIKNEMGNCGVIAVSVDEYSDVMYLSEFYVMRSVQASLEIGLQQLFATEPNISLTPPDAGLPDASPTISKFDSVIDPIMDSWVNGIYLTGKSFDLTDPYDRNQLRQIQLLCNPGTTTETIIGAFQSPKYLTQYRRITTQSKVSGRISPFVNYCLGGQVRSAALDLVGTI